MRFFQSVKRRAQQPEIGRQHTPFSFFRLDSFFGGKSSFTGPTDLSLSSLNRAEAQVEGDVNGKYSRISQEADNLEELLPYSSGVDANYRSLNGSVTSNNQSVSAEHRAKGESLSKSSEFVRSSTLFSMDYVFKSLATVSSEINDQFFDPKELFPSISVILPVSCEVESSMNSTLLEAKQSDVGGKAVDSPSRQRVGLTITESFRYQRLKLLGPLEDALPSMQADLLLEKVRVCKLLSDEWLSSEKNDEVDYAQEKEAILCEIHSYLRRKEDGIFLINEGLLEALFELIECTLFQPLPSRLGNGSLVTSEGEIQCNTRPWIHLELIYDIFLKIVVSGAAQAGKIDAFLTRQFFAKLIDLFNTEDHNERDCLKTIVHRIYSNSMSSRAIIRWMIELYFYKVIHEDESRNGLTELLEFINSIINGFAIPLKEEHIRFLKNAMIPLHRCRLYGAIHCMLTYCMRQYVFKEPALAVPIIHGILLHWPVINPFKEVFFLWELAEVFGVAEPPQLKAVALPCIKRLTHCMKSSHMEVSERAICFWKLECFRKFVLNNKEVVYGYIVKALSYNQATHWSTTVRETSFTISKELSKLDLNLYCKYKQEAEFELERDVVSKEESSQRWKKLQERATSSTNSMPKN